MAYATDKTWAAGAVVLASELNTYLRDNMKWLSTDKPMARATNSALQTIATVTTTSVTFDTNTYDNAGMHSTSTNKERFTIPTGAGGKYLFGGFVSWASSALGSYRAVFAQANAASNLSVQLSAPSAVHNSQAAASGMASLAASAYFNLACAQDSGGNLNTQTDHNAWCFWVGI